MKMAKFLLVLAVAIATLALVAPGAALAAPAGVYEFTTVDAVANVYSGDTWVNKTQDGSVLECTFSSPHLGDYVQINGQVFYVTVVPGYGTVERLPFPSGAALYMGSHFALCAVENDGTLPVGHSASMLYFAAALWLMRRAAQDDEVAFWEEEFKFERAHLNDGEVEVDYGDPCATCPRSGCEGSHCREHMGDAADSLNFVGDIVFLGSEWQLKTCQCGISFVDKDGHTMCTACMVG